MLKSLRLLPVLLLMACGSNHAHAWWNKEWATRKSITIDGSSKEAALSGSVEPAVVLVRLHDGNFHFGGAAEDGSDLRFVSSDDRTLLPYHIEKYDALLSEAFVWVAVSNVKPGEKSQIWLYSGNKKGGAERVESSKETYGGKVDLVYHFNEQSGAAGDASGNGNSAENAASNTSGAMIGGGIRLTGGAPVKVPASESLEWPANSSFSVSSWIKPTRQVPNAVLFSRGDKENGVIIGLDSGVPFVEVREGGVVQRGIATKSVPDGSWSHLAVVGSNGKINLYLGGESVGELVVTTPALATALFLGGAEGGDAAGFVGELDELQVSRIPLSVDAIKFSSITQGGDKAASVVVFGEDESPKGMFDFLEGGFVKIIMDSLTIDGWIVIIICGFMMIFTWWIMFTKVRYLNGLSAANRRFVEEWREIARHFGIIGEGTAEQAKDLGGRINDGKNKVIKASSVYRIYKIGVDEVRDRADGSDVLAKGLSSRALSAIRTKLETGFSHEMKTINSNMVFLTIAISGGPFLGLLGTVVGVMITFAAVAEAGDVNVNAIAPGIAAALAATVAGLAVAIPALFGYNYLLARVKEASSAMQIFIDEFTTKAGEYYDGSK